MFNPASLDRSVINSFHNQVYRENAGKVNCARVSLAIGSTTASAGIYAAFAFTATVSVPLAIFSAACLLTAVFLYCILLPQQEKNLQENLIRDRRCLQTRLVRNEQPTYDDLRLLQRAGTITENEIPIVFRQNIGLEIASLSYPDFVKRHEGLGTRGNLTDEQRSALKEKYKEYYITSSDNDRVQVFGFHLTDSEFKNLYAKKLKCDHDKDKENKFKEYWLIDRIDRGSNLNSILDPELRQWMEKQREEYVNKCIEETPNGVDFLEFRQKAAAKAVKELQDLQALDGVNRFYRVSQYENSILITNESQKLWIQDQKIEDAISKKIDEYVAGRMDLQTLISDCTIDKLRDSGIIPQNRTFDGLANIELFTNYLKKDFGLANQVKAKYLKQPYAELKKLGPQPLIGVQQSDIDAVGRLEWDADKVNAFIKTNLFYCLFGDMEGINKGSSITEDWLFIFFQRLVPEETQKKIDVAVEKKEEYEKSIEKVATAKQQLEAAQANSNGSPVKQKEEFQQATVVSYVKGYFTSPKKEPVVEDPVQKAKERYDSACLMHETLKSTIVDLMEKQKDL